MCKTKSRCANKKKNDYLRTLEQRLFNKSIEFSKAKKSIEDNQKGMLGKLRKMFS